MKRAPKRRKSTDDEHAPAAKPSHATRQTESRSDSETDISRSQLSSGDLIHDSSKESDVVLLQPEFGTLGRLPREILLYIMSFLETPKYIRTTTVSTAWRTAFWEGCVHFDGGSKSKRLTNAQIGAIIPMLSSQRLHSFRVGKNESLNSSLALLAHLTGLKHLDLRKVEVADAPMKKILRGCRALTYLNLSETLIRDDAAEEIAKLKNLTYLDCSFDGLIRQAETLSEIVSHLSQLRVLRWLRLDSWSLEFQSILPELSAIDSLQELAMNELVNTDIIANAASVKMLKVLELHHFEVRSAEALGFLGDLPHLEALQIVSINKVKPQNYDEVNNDWFPVMVPFPVELVPNLRLLELDSPSIHFKLYPNNIEELFELTKLQVLALRPNAVLADYISLEKLTRLSELKVLDLSPNSSSKRSQALSVQVIGLDAAMLDASKLQLANLSYTRVAAPQNLTRLKVRKSSGGAHAPGSLILAEQAFPSSWFQWSAFREVWINKNIHNIPLM